MAYSTIDGGMVIDRKTHIQALKATTGAALVALELASKRFEGQALIVEGAGQFRLEVANSPVCTASRSLSLIRRWSRCAARRPSIRKWRIQVRLTQGKLLAVAAAKMVRVQGWKFDLALSVFRSKNYGGGGITCHHTMFWISRSIFPIFDLVPLFLVTH